MTKVSKSWGNFACDRSGQSYRDSCTDIVVYSHLLVLTLDSGADGKISRPVKFWIVDVRARFWNASCFEILSADDARVSLWRFEDADHIVGQPIGNDETSALVFWTRRILSNITIRIVLVLWWCFRLLRSCTDARHIHCVCYSSRILRDFQPRSEQQTMCKHTEHSLQEQTILTFPVTQAGIRTSSFKRD